MIVSKEDRLILVTNDDGFILLGLRTLLNNGGVWKVVVISTMENVRNVTGAYRKTPR